MSVNVELILGDCLSYMAQMADKSVDCVVTDPPYPGLAGGISYKTGKVAPVTHATETVGTPWGDNLDALLEIRRVARYGAIVFCSWHSVGLMAELLGGEPVGLVSWYKRNSQNSFRNRPHYLCEFAWLIEYAPGMDWRKLRTYYDIPGLAAGCMATERELLPGTGKAAHPAQKPIALMSQLMLACSGIVLDPFMGTGTTGISAVRRGCDFVGIEQDPAYYAIATKRIAEAQMQLPLLEVT